MARTTQTPPRYDGPEDEEDLGRIDIAMDGVMHVARNADRENHAHAPIELYGFLAAADGPADGPWLLQFECTVARWLEDSMRALQHEIEALRQAMMGHSYDEAWARGGIGRRVVIRKVRKAFNQRYRDTPPEHALFNITLEPGDWNDRFGMRGKPQSGKWYWLGLEQTPANAGPRPMCAPVLLQRSGERAFEELEPHELTVLEELDDFFLDARHRKIPQSVLHALHSGDEA